MHAINLPDLEAACAVAHQRWIETRQAAGATSEVLDDTKEELMVPYGRLSEAAKALVRAEVNAVFHAVQHHGLPTDSEIGHISATAHEKWIETRRSEGATSEVLDDTKEELMVPFAQLSPAAQDLTRNQVRAIISLIEGTQQMHAS